MTRAVDLAKRAVITTEDLTNIPSGAKNLIINGDMSIWQRGTSFSATGTDYTADRWQTQGQVWTGTRSTDVPDDFQYSLDITSGSGSYGSFGQKIEAVNCKHLVGKTVTLSFYSKAVSGETNCYVLLKVPSAEDNWTSSSNISTQSISDIGSTWTKHSFTFTNLPSSVATGLLVMIFHGIGQTTQRRYTGFQLEVGDTATPFEHRPYDMELARCKRYYEKSYPIGTFAGSTVVAGRRQMGGSNVSATTSFLSGPIITFEVEKRTTPTIVLYDSAGNSGKCVRYQLGLGDSQNENITALDIGSTGLYTYSASGASRSGVGVHFTADAEL